MRKNIYLIITICISVLTIIQCNNKDQDKKDSSKDSNSYSCNVNSDICECMKIQISLMNELEDLAKKSNTNEFKNMNYTEKKEARRLVNSIEKNGIFMRRNLGKAEALKEYVNNNCNYINKEVEKIEANTELMMFYDDLKQDEDKLGKDKD